MADILCFTYNGQNNNSEPATLFWTNCDGTPGSQVVDPGSFSDSFCAQEDSVSGFNFTINTIEPCGSAPTTTTTSTTTAAPTTTTTSTTTAAPTTTTTSTTTAAPTTTSTTTAAPTTTTTSTTTAAPTTTTTSTTTAAPTTTTTSTTTAAPTTTSTTTAAPTTTTTSTTTAAPTTTTTSTTTAAPTTTSTTTAAPTTTTTSTTTAAPTTTSTTTAAPILCFAYNGQNNNSEPATLFWTNCDGTPGSQVVDPGSFSDSFCAQEDSVSGFNFTINNLGPCTSPTTTSTSTTTAAPTTTSTTTTTTTAGPTTTTSTTTSAPTTTSTTTSAPTTTSTTTSAPTTTSTTTSTTTTAPILCFTYNGQNNNSEPATIFWTNCNGTSGSQVVDPGAFSDSFCAQEGSVSGFNFTINNLGPCTSPTTTSTTTAAPTTTSTTTTAPILCFTYNGQNNNEIEATIFWTNCNGTSGSQVVNPGAFSDSFCAQEGSVSGFNFTINNLGPCTSPTTTSTTTAAPTTTSTTTTAPILCFVYNGQNNNSEPATIFWTNCDGTPGSQVVDPSAFSDSFCAREGSVSGFNFTINTIEPCGSPTTTTTSTTTVAPTTTSTTTAGPTTSTTTGGPTTTTSTTTGGPTTTTSTTTGGPTTTTSTTTGGPTTTTSTTTSTTTLPPTASYTISYSPKDGGWTSFHSFFPDWMVTMNNSLYTFKSGNLYKHYSNQTRNSYYGVLYPSKVITIFNNEPSQTKQFKTIATNSTTAWDTIVASDQGDGYIENDWYALKEGTWYAYIRRNPDDNNLAMISAQGIGNVTTYASNVLTFNFNIGDIVSTGDKLYFVSGGNMVFAGVITNHTDNTITINQTGTAPTNGSFILYIKNSVAESTATRGTYLEVQFTNYDTDYTEMYMVSSEVFKSFS